MCKNRETILYLVVLWLGLLLKFKWKYIKYRTQIQIQKDKNRRITTKLKTKQASFVEKVTLATDFFYFCHEAL